MLEKELKKKRLKMPSESELQDLAARASFTDTEQMLSAIGSGTISALNLIGKLVPPEEKEEEPSIIRKFIDQARGVSRGVKIDSVENVMFRFAACCQPVPGEKIVGFVTRGRGLTIHRADCNNAADIYDDPERVINVDWDVEKGQSFLVRLYALVEDRKNLLKEITEAVAEADVNVRGGEISVETTPATGHFVVEIQNYGQLEKALDRIRKVQGVLSAEREIGGTSIDRP
jgi:GTP pyrophosphokinase